MDNINVTDTIKQAIDEDLLVTIEMENGVVFEEVKLERLTSPHVFFGNVALNINQIKHINILEGK